MQLGDVLTALQRDTRSDLQTFLREYSAGLADGGAEGFNESIPYWEPAYRNSALANDATLGIDPDRDLQRVLDGQQRTFAALAEDEGALKDLVTNFDVTAGALAREDVALAASIPALRDTLRAAGPALASLNTALPSLRAFADDALPGVRPRTRRSTPRCPSSARPRLLMSERELRGTARVLRRTIPDVVAFNRVSIPFLEQTRSLSACTNDVLVPFQELEIPNPDEPENDGQKVRAQLQRGFPGLAGESRLSDGNNQFFHAGAGPPGNRVRPGSPPDGGSMPPEHRPDVPCENQELPEPARPRRADREVPRAGAERRHDHERGCAARERGPVPRRGAHVCEGGLARHREGPRGVPRARGEGERSPGGRSDEAPQSARTWRTSWRSSAWSVLGSRDRRPTSSRTSVCAFPCIEEKPLTLVAELPDAQAVTPGQGQTVVVAGVRIGDIGSVELEDGRAVVEMQIDREHEGLVRGGRERPAALQDGHQGHVR